MHVKPSVIFAMIHVNEIGRRSFSMVLGGLVFGTGITIDDLRSSGIYPSFIDWL